MQPFWKDNPSVPSWTESVTSWWNNTPPRLLPSENKAILYTLPGCTGCTLRRATPDDIKLLPEFWGNYYSQSRKTKCCISFEQIPSNWDIWVMVHSTGIVGSVVRRWIPNVHIRQTVYSKAGAIEYYCVHPAWRKKGVGRQLLWKVQNDTNVTFPHFILWESFQIKIPPIATGIYYVKECQTMDLIQTKPVSDLKEATVAWNMCRKNTDIYSDYTPSNECVIWKTESGYTVVWNTYHRTVPEGHWIGILLGQSSERALEEFMRECPYGILVSDSARSGWKTDSVFQWISYMLNSGFISTSIPYLCFS